MEIINVELINSLKNCIFKKIINTITMKISRGQCLWERKSITCQPEHKCLRKVAVGLQGSSGQLICAWELVFLLAGPLRGIASIND